MEDTLGWMPNTADSPYRGSFYCILLFWMTHLFDEMAEREKNAGKLCHT
jgi:hypothetical protein